MDRLLHIAIDRNSWPTPPSLPHFPRTFFHGQRTLSINVPEVLLHIGALTTPSHASGVSLAEFWAWVRYLHAISDDDHLAINTAFADLDAHQKTILSDDFGMGVPMYWLQNQLQLGPPCDGRYFVDWIAASVYATAGAPAKRGPAKCPDFVASDSSGIWHVIECKGTQSSLNYRNRQVGTAPPLPTGAIAQKRMITFPRGYTGQRLACGLFIGVEGGQVESHLQIVDPPEDKREFTVTEQAIGFAEDAVFRGVAARSLRNAGFEATASTVSAPFGRFATTRPSKGTAEELRKETAQGKEARATDELKSASSRERFMSDGDWFRGRTIEFELPSVIKLKGRDVRTVRIRQGVNTAALSELRRRPRIEEPLSEADVAWRRLAGRTTSDHDRFNATLRIGSLFVSEINLRT